MEQVVFNTIKQALTYRKQCPLCKNKLNIHRGASNDLLIYNHRILKVRDGSTEATLNIETDQVTFEYTVSEEFHLSSRNYSSTKRTLPLIYPASGKLIIGFNLECYLCHQYYYNTAFHIDTGEKRFHFATLNSEWIEIEDGPDVLGIHNIYATGITKYSHYFADGSVKECEIPVIPLNVENPKETLARLKKLIIFT